MVAVAVTDAGISLLQFTPSSGQWEELLSTASVNITSPVWKDGRIYFESGANGTNNLYCLDLADHQVYRLTCARFGAFDPSFTHSGNRLFFADYQANGYRIASLPADSLLAEKTDFDRPVSMPFVETLAGPREI